MKVFSSKRRAVPKTRRKYGTPETKKSMLERQRMEREQREAKSRMIGEIRSKNRDEFHFSYHTVDKNMVKRVHASLDELRKTLKYVDSEILRCERKLQSSLAGSGISKHIRFLDSGMESTLLEKSPSNREFEEYIETLKQKRGEIVDRINSLGS